MFSFSKVSSFCTPDLTPISHNPLFLLFFSPSIFLNLQTISHFTISEFQCVCRFFPFVHCGRKVWSSTNVAVTSTVMFLFPQSSLHPFSLFINRVFCARIYPISHWVTHLLTPWNCLEFLAKLFMLLDCGQGTVVP